MSSPGSKFRSSTNYRLLKALFFETATDKSYVVYTLKDWDHLGYPSLYLKYMETNDPTEYRFATTHLDGWEHWELLTKCAWFKPIVARWRRELELRMKSIALSRIMAEAKTSSKESFTANKYLLEKGWEPKESNKRGRPSKEEIKSQAQALVLEQTTIDDDFSRISIDKIN